MAGHCPIHLMKYCVRIHSIRLGCFVPSTVMTHKCPIPPPEGMHTMEHYRIPPTQSHIVLEQRIKLSSMDVFSPSEEGMHCQYAPNQSVFTEL